MRLLETLGRGFETEFGGKFLKYLDIFVCTAKHRGGPNRVFAKISVIDLSFVPAAIGVHA